MCVLRWSLVGKAVCWAWRNDNRGWLKVDPESLRAGCGDNWRGYSQSDHRQPRVILSLTSPLTLDCRNFCLWTHNLFFRKGWKFNVWIFLAPVFLCILFFCSRVSFWFFLTHGQFSEILIKTMAIGVENHFYISNTQFISFECLHVSGVPNIKATHVSMVLESNKQQTYFCAVEKRSLSFPEEISTRRNFLLGLKT